MQRKQPRFVAPQIPLDRWERGNVWHVLLTVDNCGNITKLRARHYVTPVDSSPVGEAETDVYPFNDLLGQIKAICIEAAVSGVQLTLPGF